MSHDVVALLAESPSRRSLLDTLIAAGAGTALLASTAVKPTDLEEKEETFA